MDAIIVHSKFGGLCNRLPPLAIASVVARKHGAPLFVYWQPDQTCPGQLTDGFDPDSFSWSIVNKSGYEEAIAEYATDRAIVLSACHETTHYKHMARRLHVPLPFGFDDQLHPFPLLDLELRLLRPSAPVAARLASLQSRLPPRADRVGVHLRRTDHPPGRFDPAAVDVAVTARLDQLLDERPGRVLVVAADNADSVAMMLSRYGSRAVHTGATFVTLAATRHTTMADAVLDLYALADTPLIIGTLQSTFSATARRLGGSVMERPGGT